MTPRERVVAAVRGEPVDRPPLSLWRHFYGDEDRGARALADATIAWTRTYGFDLVKYNPRAHYHAEPWGTTYAYGGNGRPTVAAYAVREHADWRRIDARGVGERVFVEMLEGLRRTRVALPEVPLVMTIFTPLAVCERLAGRERTLADLRERPDDVRAALDAVTETFRAFARACLGVADGIFLATTVWAQRATLGDEEYARFGRPYDLAVLEAVRDAPLNVLHVCGPDARVTELAGYPAAAVSWNAHAERSPSLGEFLTAVRDRAAVGGISDEALLAPDGARARDEVARGITQTGGRRWIAAGGCTIPPEANPAAIAAARGALA